MALPTLPPHVDTFALNMAEIERLVDIHKKLGGGGPGRRHNLEVLNRSALVLLVACWEAFVEDLAAQAFQALLDGAPEPDVFPAGVLTLASKSRRESPDPRKVWDLAGKGWRQVLMDHRDVVLDRYIGKWNTPKPSQVDELLEKLIGFSKCSSHWSWRGVSRSAAVDRLEKLVTRRGAIAHRLTGGRRAGKAEVVSGVSLVLQLAAITSNVVSDFVASRTGTRPWFLIEVTNAA
jgi:hypothetical protein